MNKLTSFYYHDAIVRTQYDDNGEPLFCLADVCKVLEISDPSNTARQLREEFSEESVLNTDSLITLPIDTGYGIKELVFITEPQLYFVMMRSRSEQAKPFRQWVVNDVLPSIRKTGKYEVKKENVLTRDQLDMYSLVLEKAGIKGNQLALSLDKAVRNKTGESVLALTETVLVADTQNQLYNPTELGNELGISAIKFNKALAYLGYQEKIDKKWEMTTLGQAKGGIYLDTNKKHSDGTPVRQLKWPYKVIYDVQDVLAEVE